MILPCFTTEAQRPLGFWEYHGVSENTTEFSQTSWCFCKDRGLLANDAEEDAVRHFAMVHDSYGVHACDVDLLHRVLREEFVRIYCEPVLQNFLNEQRAAYPFIELPDLPQTGNLDIRQV